MMIMSTSREYYKSKRFFLYLNRSRNLCLAYKYTVLLIEFDFYTTCAVLHMLLEGKKLL